MHGLYHNPHDAALLGAVHLMPVSKLAGFDAMLGVDIGGTNIRVGIVRFKVTKRPDLSKVRVWKRVLWRYADESVGREDVVRAMAKIMRKLLTRAETKGMRLAPFIGVGCPGKIGAEGSIGDGSHVLPGDWRAPGFHLPSRITEAIPYIVRHATVVLLHNDTVVQGLSEIPLMRDCKRWGILSVGTGLGNARFTNVP
jgi:predicted NBD/HSP70 family sugar kinase